jgi:hypothetical protein
MAASNAPSTDEQDTTNSTTLEIQEACGTLEHLTEVEVQSMSDSELVELREAIKSIEDTAETVRKDITDECIKSRVSPGDNLHGLSHIESHRKYVSENKVSVIMRAVSEGIDWTEFVSISASTISEEYPELTDIGRDEYSYLR